MATVIEKARGFGPDCETTRSHSPRPAESACKRPRSRLLRTGCFIALLVCAAAWFFSLWSALFFSYNKTRLVSLDRGQILIYIPQGEADAVGSSPVFQPAAQPHSLVVDVGPFCVRAQGGARRASMKLAARVGFCVPSSGTTGWFEQRTFVIAKFFSVPLWMPIVFIVSLSVLRWSPRSCGIQSACAQCRYDLVGNCSGICPECGAPIPEKQQAELNAMTTKLSESKELG